MLQRGSRNREFDRFLRALSVQQRVDQAAAEAVAAAHAVDDVQMIQLGEAIFSACGIIQHAAPVIVGSGFALAKGDGHLFKVEAVSQLLRNGLVTFLVQLSGIDIGIFRFDAEHVLRILFVGNADIHILAQIGHGRSGLLSGPQLAAVI